MINKPEILSAKEMDTCFNKWSEENQGNISKKLGNTFSQAIAQAQCDKDYRKMLLQFVEWVESHKDNGLDYDWGRRRGAPIITIILDPLEYIALQSQLEEEN